MFSVDSSVTSMLNSGLTLSRLSPFDGLETVICGGAKSRSPVMEPLPVLPVWSLQDTVRS